MNRQSLLLAALAGVLVLVLFYFFLWKPQSEDLARIQLETDDAIAQQAVLETQIASLESVRASAPEIEAALAAAESLVPREAALPAALRQFQLAADDSGVDLLSIAPGRPAASPVTAELARISLSINAEGSYFQLVDFFRRLEDPTITPRVVLFENVTVSAADYPRLGAALTGAMFALLPAPPAPATDAPAPTGTPTPTPTDAATEDGEAA